MKSLISQVHKQLQKAFEAAFPDVTELFLEITPSTQEKFGHYQCNTAMKIARSLDLSPREVAKQALLHLNTEPVFDKVEIAGPGFINLFIKKEYLARCVEQILLDPRLGIDPPSTAKKIIVEYSSPNTAKELHVGHLRSTIIGDCLARLFEFLGYEVLRLNHIGDWGTQFGMLIAFIKEQAPEVLVGEESTDLSHLMSWYRLSKEKFDHDEAFKQRARLEVVKLQSGEKKSLQAWEIICEISRKSYQEIYDLLDVKIVERGESYYNSQLPLIVADLENRGLLQLSGGAKCLFLDGFTNREGSPLPLIVQKSDGGYNYSTTDLAAIYQRCEVEKADRIIYITDAGQATHFSMIFKAAKEAGYVTDQQLDHVTFGLVMGSDGKKFRTRAGDTEKLIDLLVAAICKAEEILLERNPQMESLERKELAKAIGIAAIKYADLSTHRQSDYVFSYEKMLRFEGNTAAFLLYAYVRILGIKRKCTTKENLGSIEITHPSEIALAVHILQFQEIVQSVAKDLLPNRLTEYLFNLAEKFNGFFRDCRVKDSPEEKSRLLLCEAAGQTLKQGLYILGIKPVEHM